MVSTLSSDPTLDDEAYDRGISDLASQNPDLAAAVSRWGNPPLWTHPPGFPGIVIAILAQQVSIESAQAAFTKLENAIAPLNPERLTQCGRFHENELDLRRNGGFNVVSGSRSSTLHQLIRQTGASHPTDGGMRVHKNGRIFHNL
jgi:3-methyladenine DNA glycosylase/8-oxoguanine DNA glycosylase